MLIFFIGFTHFMMFSEWQDIRNPRDRNIVYQDMSQPLSHYWIASSHNTYVFLTLIFITTYYFRKSIVSN